MELNAPGLAELMAEALCESCSVQELQLLVRNWHGIAFPQLRIEWRSDFDPNTFYSFHLARDIFYYVGLPTNIRKDTMQHAHLYTRELDQESHWGKAQFVLMQSEMDFMYMSDYECKKCVSRHSAKQCKEGKYFSVDPMPESVQEIIWEDEFQVYFPQLFLCIFNAWFKELKQIWNAAGIKNRDLAIDIAAKIFDIQATFYYLVSDVTEHLENVASGHEAKHAAVTTIEDLAVNFFDSDYFEQWFGDN